MAVKRETWTKVSPRVLGILGFTMAMTMGAVSTAAFVAITSTPKEQKPCSSGGETWTMAASKGRMPRLKSQGTWWSMTGT